MTTTMGHRVMCHIGQDVHLVGINEPVAANHAAEVGNAPGAEYAGRDDDEVWAEGANHPAMGEQYVPQSLSPTVVAKGHAVNVVVLPIQCDRTADGTTDFEMAGCELLGDLAAHSRPSRSRWCHQRFDHIEWEALRH